MSPHPAPPRRQPGSPHATTVVIVDLLPGAQAFTDTYRDAPPILVIDTGPTEVQLSLPGDPVTLDDLRVVDVLHEATVAYRSAVVARLTPHLPPGTGPDSWGSVDRRGRLTDP